MTLGDDERAVAVACLHFLESLLGLVAIHDFLEALLLDVAHNPLLARAIAGRHIAPWVDEEEVGQGTAGRAITSLVATQAAVD